MVYPKITFCCCVNASAPVHHSTKRLEGAAKDRHGVVYELSGFNYELSFLVCEPDVFHERAENRMKGPTLIYMWKITNQRPFRHFNQYIFFHNAFKQTIFFMYTVYCFFKQYSLYILLFKQYSLFILLFKQNSLQATMWESCSKTCNCNEKPPPCFDRVTSDCWGIACNGACEEGNANYVIILQTYFFQQIFSKFLIRVPNQT